MDRHRHPSGKTIRDFPALNALQTTGDSQRSRLSVFDEAGLKMCDTITQFNKTVFEHKKEIYFAVILLNLNAISTFKLFYHVS